MTVGELRKKLELYKDDVEIFIGNLAEPHGYIWYSEPIISQQTVEARKSKYDQSQWHYTLFVYHKHTKKHTILVIE